MMSANTIVITYILRRTGGIQKFEFSEPRCSFSGFFIKTYFHFQDYSTAGGILAGGLRRVAEVDARPSNSRGSA